MQSQGGMLCGKVLMTSVGIFCLVSHESGAAGLGVLSGSGEKNTIRRCPAGHQEASSNLGSDSLSNVGILFQPRQRGDYKEVIGKELEEWVYISMF